jgi:ubiquinone biosynthesis protein
MSRSRFSRSLQIILAFGSYGWYWMRWHHKSPERLPPKLSQTIEKLGTTFIKLGQGLSLRRDLLPAAYLEALESLQSTVPPFDSEIAVRTIESAFGQPVETLFKSFERTPFAAASIAQVHRAQMADGRRVAVKVRRPAIVRQVAADLWLLRRLLRIGMVLFPGLKEQQPLDLVDELEEFLRLEMDLAHEASNMRRLARAFDELPNVTMPALIEPLAHSEVLVQEFSHGQPLRTVFASKSAQELAYVVLDAYVQQLFAKGVFHADPHPGNLFIMADGRVCFHDFGSIGYLDPESRTSLAQLIAAIVINDATGVLDAATAMGFIQGAVDRHTYQRAISEILERMASLPLKDWSVAEAIWQIARIGSGKNFRLPRHLLVLLRTLFLAENTLRALVPNFDLIAALRDRSSEIQRLIESNSTQLPLTERVARATQQMPALLADALRQLRIDDGRPSLGVHHHGLEELEVTISRTGNRLSLALITLGLYIAGSILMLHGGGPQLWEHVPLGAALAYGLAVFLSLRLIFAIRHSGKL